MSHSRSKCMFTLGIIFCGLTWIAVFYLDQNYSLMNDGKEKNLSYLGHLESSQSKRLSRLSKVCSNLTSKPINEIEISRLDHFIVDDENQLIYCFVPKVACTNWKRVLLALRSSADGNPLNIKGNETHSPNLFKTLNQLPKADALYKLENYMKFVFVRHPYERLLSAYRNKFEQAYSDYFHTRFGRKIVKTYRPNATDESLSKGHDVSFTEFLQYVTELNTTQDMVLFNEHWRPIMNLCYPCSVNYDVVGKYETLVQDAEYTLWKARLSDKVFFPRRDQTYNRRPSSDLALEYFRGLDTEILLKLGKVYEEDLRLFNYPRDYFHPFKNVTI